MLQICYCGKSRRPWTLLSCYNTSQFFVKTFPLRIHGVRCSGIPAGHVWMGNCILQQMRDELSSRTVEIQTNEPIHSRCHNTTSFITIFAFFFLFVYGFLNFVIIILWSCLSTPSGLCRFVKTCKLMLAINYEKQGVERSGLLNNHPSIYVEQLSKIMKPEVKVADCQI